MVILHYSLVSQSPTEQEARLAGHYRMPPSLDYPAEEEFAFHRTAHEIKYRFGIPRGEKNSES